MDDLRIGSIQRESIRSGPGIHQKGGGDFEKIIHEAVDRVSTLEKEADGSVLDLLKGKADVHETMLALQKADISMRMLMSIRNKVIEAYKEIMHMQF